MIHSALVVLRHSLNAGCDCRLVPQCQRPAANGTLTIETQIVNVDRRYHVEDESFNPLPQARSFLPQCMPSPRQRVIESQIVNEDHVTHWKRGTSVALAHAAGCDVNRHSISNWSINDAALQIDDRNLSPNKRSETTLVLYLALAVLVLACGCNTRTVRRFADPGEIEKYATLPLASATHNAALRAELAIVVAEKGTPAQLAADNGTLGERSQSAAVTEALRELTQILPPNAVERFRKRLDVVYPDERFRFPPLGTDNALDVLQAGDERRRAYQQFFTSRNPPRVYQHARGVSADSTYISAVQVGNRLLGLAVADALARDEPQSATEPLDAMFHSAEWLAREKHLLPRLAAVHLRGEALTALDAVARHPQATAEDHAALAVMIDRQLTNWPSDADAWIGERAEGLIAYELIRDGYLLSLLPFEELKRIREDVGVEKAGAKVAKNLDFDEQFYLRSMRTILAACQRPYFEQLPDLQQLQSELERLRNSDRYPYVADQLLLVDIAGRQKLLALDRARCDVRQIAFQLAAGQSPPENVNPLTGSPFSIAIDAHTVTIGPIDQDEPTIRLPIRGPQAN